MLYASYLAKRRRIEDADRQLKRVLLKQADDPFSLNNVGLIYLEMGRPDDALAQAYAAEALGLKPSRLRLQLEKQGLWREPLARTDVKPAVTAPAAPASAAR
jgi:Flp pilus assembly protein TadD